MTIRAGETDDFTHIVIWGPDGSPLSHIFEFNTESCEIMFYSDKRAITHHRGQWKHPLDYVHLAKAIKFRTTPPDAADSLIMTLPGAYATRWEPFVAGSQPNPDAPRLH